MTTSLAPPTERSTRPSVTATPVVPVPWPSGRVSLFALLFLLSLAPVLLVDIPAGVDVPNHLARMGLLARSDADPSPYYDVRWVLNPNLAMDVIVPALGSVLGVEVAFKTFYVVTQVLLVTGAVALELAEKRKFSYAGFVALLFLYSTPFAWGFLNFAFGLGLALWGIAAFVLLAGRPMLVRAAVHALVLLVLFVAHFLALGLYGFTIGLIELWRLVHARSAPAEFLRAAAWLAAPLAVVMALLQAGGGAIGGPRNEWLLLAKSVWLLASVNGYSWWLSGLFGLASAVALLILVRRRALDVQRAGWLLLTGFGMLFVLMPFRLLETAFVDVRVVPTAALILPAFVRIRGGDRVVRAVATALVGVLLANVAVVAHAQWTYSRRYGQVLDSFRFVERASRVLVATDGDLADPPKELLDYPLYHAPTLAADLRDSYVPSLFAQPGKQPLTLRDEVRHLAAGDGAVLPFPYLESVARGEAAEAPAFVRAWVQDYDYLYVIGEASTSAMPQQLQPLYRGESFTLYRIGP